MDYRNEFLLGNVMDVLRQLPDETMDCVVTSPPYYGLRTYGGAEVDWDGWSGELGLEPTPELYLTHLWAVFGEVWRVMKKTGTMWVNIGDTYSSGGGCGSKEYLPKHTQFGKLTKPDRYQPPKKVSGLPPKCLVCVPERFMLGMIDRGWILRNKIVWHKPNPMPSSAKDRFTNTYEPVYFFTKAKRYWFDLDAVRERHSQARMERSKYPIEYSEIQDTPRAWTKENYPNLKKDAKVNLQYNPSGKNPGDVWRITTQPFPEAHFSTFPEELARRCIRAGCPREVCPKCRKGRIRIVKPSPEYAKNLGKDWAPGNIPGSKRRADYGLEKHSKAMTADYQTLGWTSCSCGEGYVPGIILDPFGGSGRACHVAWEQGRDFTYIDIKPEYTEMAKDGLEKKMRSIPRAGDEEQAETIGQETLEI